MTRYLAGVLTVIAVGTLLIAYGLLNPRIATADGMAATIDSLRVPASDRVMVLDNGTRVPMAQAYPVAQSTYVSRPAYAERAARPAEPVDNVRYSAPVQRTRVVERAPRRDWTKTAMVVGGSSAAGAGLGALLGGKKGALIGAALGGGAATIYEVRKR